MNTLSYLMDVTFLNFLFFTGIYKKWKRCTQLRAIAYEFVDFIMTDEEEDFRIDRGPLRGSSFSLRRFEPARVKPN